VLPHAPQSWQYILVLRELYLEPGLRGLGSARENIQDQIRTVDGFYIQGLFNVIDLGTGQFIVKYGNANIPPLYKTPDLFQFAFTNKKFLLSGCASFWVKRFTVLAPAVSARNESSSSHSLT
jgi:hypothetical protein